MPHSETNDDTARPRFGGEGRFREIRALAILVVLALLSLCGCGPTAGSKEAGPEILEIAQGTFTGGDFPLQVERRDEPRVIELRRQEKLDEVVAGAKGELEIFERLTAWARSQFEPGVPDPYPLSNGLSILADLRSGKTGGFCGQYAYLLGDALKSLGYFAVRYVELESEAGAGHFAVEAWCDDLGRWVVLDPLNAALYEVDHLPQSAVELHDALIARRSGAIKVVRLPLGPGSPGAGRRPAARPAADSAPIYATGGVGATAPTSDADLLALFYDVAVSTRNDFAPLERPLTIAEREGLFVRYADPRVAPFRHMNFVLNSVRREDFLAPMNQVQIEVHPDLGSSRVHTAFSTRGTCPHFAHYRIRIGDGPWKDSGPLVGWTLTPGENRLEVRAVNAFGVEGPVFRVRLRT